MCSDVSNANRAVNPRPPLMISSEAEFQSLMEEVDREMIDEGVGIPARPITAGLKITGRYDVVLNAVPGDKPILPGVYTPDQISLRIHDWMQKRYGDRLKLPFALGRVVIPLRGALYVIKCPVILGSVRFICEPRNFGQPRETIGVRSVPTCNVLDLIEDFTADLARSLTAEEVVKIGLSHVSAMGAFIALHAINDVRFVSEALGDLDAAVSHLTEHKPQTGLSKWAGLQAVEKLLKAYIASRGGAIQRHHRLKDHVADAVKQGLPQPPKQYIEDLQCPAGVRYGEVQVSVEEAGLAHMISLEMCEVAAQSIGQVLGRDMPKSPLPTIDGMPATEFLKKHATTG